MARTARVWLRKEDAFYYTTLHGKQVKLSQDRDEAQTLFHALMAKRQAMTASGLAMTVRQLADLYLDDVRRIRRPNTHRTHTYTLDSFCDAVGKTRRVADLKVHHVSKWIAEKTWGESYSCSARTTLLACLNWGVNQGYLDDHPLRRLKRGSHKRRERVLTEDERAKIRAAVKPDFADFLLGLEQTGARPFSELATVTAAMIDWPAETITFAVHKNVAKGKTRTIYLTPVLARLLRRLAAEHPTGLLFRNSRGNVWASHDATRRLHHATDKLKLPRASLYAYRHTYLTDALAKGMTADVLAELAGNSAVTIARSYAHLSKKREAMLEAARRAVE